MDCAAVVCGSVGDDEGLAVVIAAVVTIVTAGAVVVAVDGNGVTLDGFVETDKE